MTEMMKKMFMRRMMRRFLQQRSDDNNDDDDDDDNDDPIDDLFGEFGETDSHFADLLFSSKNYKNNRGRYV